MTERPWFAHKEFTSLEIRKHKSLADHAIVKAIKIGDVRYINELVGRIEQIPANGDMMISFSGAAEHIELVFYSGDRVQAIDVIQKGFKTPSTGFNPKNDYEKEVYAEIDAVLFPALEKILPKVEHVEFDFGDFSLEYTGSRFVDLAPVSLSFDIAAFELRAKGGKTQSIEIYAGQVPPGPMDLEVDGVKISLLTYHSKEQKRIYPGFFQVVGGSILV
jgi:hypothetical protein